MIVEQVRTMESEATNVIIIKLVLHWVQGLDVGRNTSTLTIIMDS